MHKVNPKLKEPTRKFYKTFKKVITKFHQKIFQKKEETTFSNLFY